VSIVHRRAFFRRVGYTFDAQIFSAAIETAASRVLTVK
jgi:hypothetical protein